MPLGNLRFARSLVRLEPRVTFFTFWLYMPCHPRADDTPSIILIPVAALPPCLGFARFTRIATDENSRLYRFGRLFRRSASSLRF